MVFLIHEIYFTKSIKLAAVILFTIIVIQFVKERVNS